MSEALNQDVSLKYVYCEHVPENSEAIVAAVEDCDLIALEVVGGNAEERDIYEGVMNSITLSGKEVNFGPIFLSCLAEGLRGSGKIIKLIDIDEEDEQYELL